MRRKSTDKNTRRNSLTGWLDNDELIFVNDRQKSAREGRNSDKCAGGLQQSLNIPGFWHGKPDDTVGARFIPARDQL